jgi:hypothetical protein
METSRQEVADNVYQCKVPIPFKLRDIKRQARGQYTWLRMHFFYGHILLRRMAPMPVSAS